MSPLATWALLLTLWAALGVSFLRAHKRSVTSDRERVTR